MEYLEPTKLVNTVTEKATAAKATITKTATDTVKWADDKYQEKKAGKSGGGKPVDDTVDLAKLKA